MTILNQLLDALKAADIVLCGIDYSQVEGYSYDNIPFSQISKAIKDGQAFLNSPKITKEQCHIQVIASDELDTYHNQGYEPEVVEAFTQMVDEYGLWGWCSVEVRVSFMGMTASTHLGGCSYKSKADFIECGDYYAQMVDECLTELNAQASALIAVIEREQNNV